MVEYSVKLFPKSPVKPWWHLQSSGTHSFLVNSLDEVFHLCLFSLMDSQVLSQIFKTPWCPSTLRYASKLVHTLPEKLPAWCGFSSFHRLHSTVSEQMHDFATIFSFVKQYDRHFCSAPHRNAMRSVSKQAVGKFLYWSLRYSVTLTLLCQSISETLRLHQQWLLNILGG